MGRPAVGRAAVQRPEPVPPLDLLPTVRTVTEPGAVDALALEDLSDWFDPFLPHFLGETLRCGGEVTVAEAEGRVTALHLLSPGEEAGTVFTRSRALAELFLRRRPDAALFADFPLAPRAEPHLIYRGEPGAGSVGRALRHPVRRSTGSDRERLLGLLRAVYGRVDERWFDGPPPPNERGFVVEADGALVAAAFVARVGRWGRLHSLAVHPRFRGLGLGTDLAVARLLWLHAAGATQALSEIAERNRPSRAIAEGVGMRVVGRIYRHDRAAPRPRAPGPSG